MIRASFIQDLSLNDSLAFLGFMRLRHFSDYLSANKAGKTNQRQCYVYMDTFFEEAKNGDNFIQSMHNSTGIEKVQIHQYEEYTTSFNSIILQGLLYY